jgi:xanthine dehydrogenase small subunit
MAESLEFHLNQQLVQLRNIPPTTTLLRYLRDEAKLTGTKEGCAEGDCGACTVAVAEIDNQGVSKWRAVNSCLLLLPMIQGKHVLTVEGIATRGAHPSQLAMQEALGSQCGYCTPGIVMSLFEATYRNDFSEPWQLDDQLCGNLCRCTGYRPIKEAALQVAGTCPKDTFSAQSHRPTLPMSVTVVTAQTRYVTPENFNNLFIELAHPQARIVSGGTDLSLEITKKFLTPSHLVSVEGIAELKQLTETANHFSLGSGAPLSELEDFCVTRLPSVHRMLRYFGARQIKHRGTIGGNICTASPIGDLAPVFLSLDAVAVLRSAKGVRRVKLNEFFVSYRKTVLEQGEILASIEIEKANVRKRNIAFKVSKRRELDISAVSAGMSVDVLPDGTIQDIKLAFGGMAATPARAFETEKSLMGKPWTLESIQAARPMLEVDFKPMSDHRGSAAWRMLLAKNFLDGFFIETKSGPAAALKAQHVGTIQGARV